MKSQKITSSTETANKPANKGIPFGSMKVPVELSRAFSAQSTLESKLVISREEIKKATATFYTRFKAKYPKAGLADFARQFDKDVPFLRAEYKRNPVYLAIDNMFRYMPEVKTNGKAETEAQKKKRTDAQKAKIRERKAATMRERNKVQRLLMAIVHQIGIPNHILEIAATRCGFVKTEIESLWSVEGALTDVGLGVYQMVIRATGVPATKETASKAVQESRKVQSVPTAAELANAAKGAPTVSRQITNGRTTTVLPTVEYKGKGQYQRTIKRADNLSRPATK